MFCFLDSNKLTRATNYKVGKMQPLGGEMGRSKCATLSCQVGNTIGMMYVMTSKERNIATFNLLWIVHIEL